MHLYIFPTGWKLAVMAYIQNKRLQSQPDPIEVSWVC